MKIPTRHTLVLLTLVAGCGGSSGEPSGGAAGSATGAAGSATGSTGSATGSAGSATGSAGMMGPAGTAGAPGAAGMTGAAGTAGTTGAAGMTGAAGTAGAPGAAGMMAAAGTTGAPGAAGMMAAAGTTGAGGSAVPSDILAPAQGALLGLYYGAGTTAATDAMIGRMPQLHLVYYAWADDWTRGAKSDLASGRIPLVNWEPDGIDFNDIVSGSLDATITARAMGAKALTGKFFLDFAAEMNGDEGWSGNDAPLYVNAYRHIHDLFAAAGATNVVWAWCPNVTDVDNTNKHTLDYYPGDAYVDWTGVDGYNWGDTNGGWQTFQQVFGRIYPILATKNKPIIIGEMASASVGGDKGMWIDAIIPTLKAQFPMIKALVWFDVDKEKDWRINSSADALTAFAKMATDPYFNP